MRILVTGGCGFIGSAVVRQLMARTDCEVFNLDKLTHAANPEALEQARWSNRYHFIHADIRDADTVSSLVHDIRPDAIMNLAAETHVDRSIDSPEPFVRTNINGTLALLEAALHAWRNRSARDRDRFRFLQVSTDEVYGSLEGEGQFREDSPYAPSSPYSASKAASDHLVAAWHRTYGLPTLTTNGSNTFGPWQSPDKLIPLAIHRASTGQSIPVYGDGQNVRDWLFVEDHAAALLSVLDYGTPGRNYNIGGNAERTNMQVIRAICSHLDRRAPARAPHWRLAEFTPDRPGHDFRYAVDTSRIREELGWRPEHRFDTALRRTVDWFAGESAAAGR